jgi:SAM-dependent methyltransferase
MSNRLPPIDDPTHPDFWDIRYQAGDNGWDIAQPAPPFVDLLSEPDAPAPGRMLVLGCGRGYDAIFFAGRGFSVLGVDFSHIAIEEARNATAHGTSGAVFLEHDMYALPHSYDHTFDYVLEHTCLTAIPPAKRPEYVQLVRRMLAESGRYIALFLVHGQAVAPPFDISIQEIHRLFDPYFVIERLEKPAHSVDLRDGLELFAIMSARASDK